MNIRCKICQEPITTDNTIKSHILTEKIYISPLVKTTNKKLLGFSSKSSFDPCHSITDNTILCKKCDRILGKYKQERTELTRIKDDEIVFNEGLTVLKPFDGNKIKLAYMADILRASFTEIDIFNKINLGPFEEAFKKCLYEDEGDPDNSFPVIVGKVKFKNGFLASVIPQRIRIRSINYYRTITSNGWVWLIKVDNRNDLFAQFSVEKRKGGALVMDFDRPKFKRNILNEIYEIIK